MSMMHILRKAVMQQGAAHAQVMAQNPCAPLRLVQCATADVRRLRSVVRAEQQQHGVFSPVLGWSCSKLALPRPWLARHWLNEGKPCFRSGRCMPACTHVEIVHLTAFGCLWWQGKRFVSMVAKDRTKRSLTSKNLGVTMTGVPVVRLLMTCKTPSRKGC
eukprot:221475-Chlamydomonas_euryale.AAC.9